MTRHILGFSGGADSQAVALWLRQRLPPEDIILLNSDVGGNEHPITTQFITDYSANIFPVHVVRPLIADLQGVGTKDAGTGERRGQFADDDLLTFDRLAFIKGRFPSRKAQFCTQFLKLGPSLRWIRTNIVAKGLTFERYAGIRRDESDPRQNTPAFDWDDWFDCIIHYPIATWSKLQVFNFLKEGGEETNPLYKLGFGRVGCAPCINSNKDDVLRWATLFPEMIDKVRQWEQSTQRTFFPPIVPGLRINWVDEVVAWSKTARGGRQGLLPFAELEMLSGGCQSKYGLCE